MSENGALTVGLAGPVAFRRGEEHIFLGRELAQQRDYGEATAEIIDAEVTRRVGRSAAAAADILRQHRPALEAIANTLLANETLDREAIESVIAAATPARQRVLAFGGSVGKQAGGGSVPG
jgi:cell division protease FtsH